ncbi:LLM class flavin-dependent oxidoreductase [Microbacterium cremeum]|uniref:LLM class flavin-dependent oxidoreductase n=1 Tax=Microbacterium cremeum TaxID=2782169 RepID=UPI001887F0EA|nr:LLM class flavin-dependent oxidoreductase [Microbacterium cremeum]
MTALLSIGIAAAAGPGLAARLAPVVERAGLHALWVNDTPGDDALAVIAAAARATDRLVLATGVLPMDRRTPEGVAAEVRRLGLPRERLVLGIGSGAAGAGALARVEAAAATLRAERPARTVVGALGPRMRRLAAEASDGVLLSWLTPDAARVQAAEAHAVSSSTHVALYVRTAADAAAVPRLEAEAERYGGYPSYAANFARLGVRAGETVIRPDGLADGIRHHRAGVDELVLRAIVADETASAYEGFVQAVAEAATA